MRGRLIGLVALAGAGIALIGVGAFLAFQVVMTYEINRLQQGDVAVPVYRPAPTAAFGSMLALVGFATLLSAAAGFNLLSTSTVPRLRRYAALLMMGGVSLILLGSILTAQIVHQVFYSTEGSYPIARETYSQAPIAAVGVLLVVGGFVLSITSLWLFAFRARASRDTAAGQEF